jgi:uncharacterized protein YkwD
MVKKRGQLMKRSCFNMLAILLLTACILSACSALPVNITSEIPAQASPSTTKAAPSPTLLSGPIYTPSAAPFSPTNTQIELMQYALELINADRQAVGLSPVALNFNAAAQYHAQDMLDNYYWAHWGTDGLKPYMRYTLEGGLGYDRENVGYTGYFDREENENNYADIDPKQEIRDLEYQMVNNDAKSNWGHRDNILYTWHQRVNIGIAFDKKRLALVQQFEGNYLNYYQPPTITGNSVVLSGKFSLGELNNITICYDEFPQCISSCDLINGPYHSYDLGKRTGCILPPPPPGQFYKNLPAEAIQASKWETTPSGEFLIEADISPILVTGRGVYTIVILAKVNGELINLSNYSIFVN